MIKVQKISDIAFNVTNNNGSMTDYYLEWTSISDGFEDNKNRWNELYKKYGDVFYVDVDDYFQLIDVYLEATFGLTVAEWLDRADLVKSNIP